MSWIINVLIVKYYDICIIKKCPNKADSLTYRFTISLCRIEKTFFCDRTIDDVWTTAILIAQIGQTKR